MSLKTLEELCIVNVVENFRTNNAVLNIYDLGDQMCTDIVRRLMRAGRINDDNIERLQVKGIESLKFNEFYLYFSNKMSCWLADIVAAGLEELDIECRDFHKTVEKAIVAKYEKSATTSSRELETAVVPALHTLRLKECSSIGLPCSAQLSRMLSIFAGTLKSVHIECLYENTPTLQNYQFYGTIGTLHLEKLSLCYLTIWNACSVTITPSLQHLKTLTLDGIKGLSDQYVLSILKVAGQSIQHLCIQEGYDITDNTLQNIQLHCSNLVSLNLSCNKKLTTDGLAQFFGTASLTKLQRLTLKFNDAVTYNVVAMLAIVGQLLYINLDSCDCITRHSLNALTSITTLRYFSSLNCNMLDDEDTENFMTCHGLENCRVYDKLHADD